jgi:hypothetical protein
MKRKTRQLGKKTGLEEAEIAAYFKVGFSGFIALALSVFAGFARAGGNDATDFQQLIDKPQANEKLSERCDLKPEGGPCKALFWKYYFNKKTTTCQEFVHGGCDGVVPFETREECEKSCLDQKTQPVVDDQNCGPFPGYPCGTRYFTVSIRDFDNTPF